MRPEEKKKDQVAQWYKKADGDLWAVEHLLEDGLFLWIVGFHAQQAAEKYLKAFLTWHGVDFPKTHDIGLLLDLILPINPSLASELEDADTLTPYGAIIRYPADIPEISMDKAKRALELATLVRDRVKIEIEKVS